MKVRRTWQEKAKRAKASYIVIVAHILPCANAVHYAAVPKESTTSRS